MKRLLISLAFLLVIIAFSFFGVYNIELACDEITKTIDLAITAAQKADFDTAIEQSQKAEKIYRRYEDFFIGFINRESAEDTGVLLAGLCPLANKESLPAFLSKCEEAKIGLLHIQNEYRVIPENFF